MQAIVGSPFLWFVTFNLTWRLFFNRLVRFMPLGAGEAKEMNALAAAKYQKL